ncbi:MAG: hypothetical protein CMH83_17455 [Nocardioides sp.]|nr:hypothetical protein [Nocardioides sp.]
MRYFLGVGAQKCGTTWLHRQLERHPQVALPVAGKELHYFDSLGETRAGEPFAAHQLDVVERLARTMREDGVARPAQLERVANVARAVGTVLRGHEAYRSDLAEAAGEGTLVAGEITPAYACCTEEQFALMRTVLDTPRVVFVMRDPLARHWSAVRYQHADPEQRARTWERAHRWRTYRARGDYRTTVELLDRTFPADAVLHLFYEDLFTEETLRRVAAHLGVDERWDWDLGTVVKGSGDDERPDPPPGLERWLAEQYVFVRDRFGGAVPASWDH